MRRLPEGLNSGYDDKVFGIRSNGRFTLYGYPLRNVLLVSVPICQIEDQQKSKADACSEISCRLSGVALGQGSVVRYVVILLNLDNRTYTAKLDVDVGSPTTTITRLCLEGWRSPGLQEFQKIQLQIMFYR